MVESPSSTVSFRPAPFLRNPHLQTIVASQLHSRPPPSETVVVDLKDGDQLAVEVSTPPNWDSKQRSVVLIHGLCGCHGSPYMVRIARKLYESGIRAVRMNQRGCGTGEGLARLPYHAGRSDDLLDVLRVLRRSAPDSSVVGVGFSLGGNLALKLAGEIEAGEGLERVIAVCPPVNLLSCAYLISLPSARLYDQYFVRLLRQRVEERHKRFPELGRVELPERLTLYDFDDIYTAPQCGFRGAMDYYRKSSAAALLADADIPCRILFAQDDPFIDAHALDDVRLPSSVEVVRTRHGGHLGFLGNGGRSLGYHWMDGQVLRWIHSGERASLSQPKLLQI